VNDISREQRVAAMRASERLLSGVRPPTMREQLAVITARTDLDRPPDYYGDGPVRELEDHIAAQLGTEAAAYFPTGTMAQQVALRYGADKTGNPTVALHPLGHQEVHERHAYAALTGLRAVWPTTAPRNATAAEVAELDEPFGTLVVELPLRDAGFVLPAWDELVAVAAQARRRGARVHFDGARIWDCVPYLEHSPAEIAALADSTYVSFYKSVGAFSGATLAGTAELIAYARAWRHRYGGNVFQQWPAVLSALAGLTDRVALLPDQVRHARTVAAALATLPGARIHPDPPHTHQFRLWLPFPADTLDAAALALAEREKTWFVGGWSNADVPGMAVAEVTVADAAMSWTADDITGVGARFLALAATVE
jgi:threonine aldolase